MTTQRLVPGGPYVNESGSLQALIPGGPYINETASGGGGGGSSSITAAAGVTTPSTLAGASSAESALSSASGVSTAATLTGSDGSAQGFDLSGAAYEFRNNTGTLIASTAVTFWVNNVTTGALVVKITGYSTNGSGIVGVVSDAALSTATEYRVAYEFSTGEYGVAKLTTEP